MMVTPANEDTLDPPILAVIHLVVEFHGKTSHAAASPWDGRKRPRCLRGWPTTTSPALRQHMYPTDKVHGIITHGGDAPNIIPHYTRSEWYVRAATKARSTSSRPGSWPASRRRPTPPGAPWRSPPWATSTRTWSATRHWPPCTGPTRRPWGGPCPRVGTRPGGRRLHRHGEREPRGARHPPLPGPWAAPRHQPPGGVRRRHPHPGGRPGAARRGPGHGLDGDRPGAGQSLGGVRTH